MPAGSEQGAFDSKLMAMWRSLMDVMLARRVPFTLDVSKTNLSQVCQMRARKVCGPDPCLSRLYWFPNQDVLHQSWLGNQASRTPISSSASSAAVPPREDDVDSAAAKLGKLTLLLNNELLISTLPLVGPGPALLVMVHDGHTPQLHQQLFDHL